MNTPFTKIQQTVATTIADSGERVFNEVVSAMADQEIDRRIAATISVVADIHKTGSELNKTRKQTVKTFEIEDPSKIASESYTPDTVKEINVLEKKLAKLNKALDAAYAADPDFSQLYNVAK